jgi:predicted RNA methylase
MPIWWVDFSGGDVRVQQANLNRLKRIIRRLYDHPNTSSQEWVEYNQSRLYSPAEIERKKSVVRRFLESHKPKTVLDAGSNTGEFSFLAAEAGARVIAVDSDHDATDALYRRARNERQQIHPIWMDLANPRPDYTSLV